MEQIKRRKRVKLLKAFDTYKSNVAYGIEKEDATTYSNTIKWYQDLLDLKNSAFVVENIPSRIKYYLTGYELGSNESYVTYDNNGNEKLVSEAEFKEYLQSQEV